jgi:hypothetical protein
MVAILLTRISAPSVASSAQRGWYPDEMIVKTIARRIGLNPSSNRQLMKTALETVGLDARRFATRRLLRLYPQRVADSLGGSGTLAAHRSNFDAAIKGWH